MTAQQEWHRLACTGLALVRDGHPFEAHEVWEELWLELRGDDRLWLQALIQLAVSGLHAESGNAAGAGSLREKATVKLARLAAAGFALPDWAAESGLPLPGPLLDRLARQEAGRGAVDLWT
jgi:hypothetical protein